MRSGANWTHPRKVRQPHDAAELITFLQRHDRKGTLADWLTAVPPCTQSLARDKTAIVEIIRAIIIGCFLIYLASYQRRFSRWLLPAATRRSVASHIGQPQRPSPLQARCACATRGDLGEEKQSAAAPHPAADGSVTLSISAARTTRGILRNWNQLIHP